MFKYNVCTKFKQGLFSSLNVIYRNLLSWLMCARVIKLFFFYQYSEKKGKREKGRCAHGGINKNRKRAGGKRKKDNCARAGETETERQRAIAGPDTHTRGIYSSLPRAELYISIYIQHTARIYACDAPAYRRLSHACCASPYICDSAACSRAAC